jgi:hypothetical protein
MEQVIDFLVELIADDPAALVRLGDGGGRDLVSGTRRAKSLPNPDFIALSLAWSLVLGALS